MPSTHELPIMYARLPVAVPPQQHPGLQGPRPGPGPSGTAWPGPFVADDQDRRGARRADRRPGVGADRPVRARQAAPHDRGPKSPARPGCGARRRGAQRRQPGRAPGRPGPVRQCTPCSRRPGWCTGRWRCAPRGRWPARPARSRRRGTRRPGRLAQRRPVRLAVQRGRDAVQDQGPVARWLDRLLISGCAVARLIRPWIRVSPAATGPRPTGNTARATQSATNARSATPKPCPCTIFIRNEELPGSIAPSRTSARTWEGKSCAYQVPR